MTHQLMDHQHYRAAYNPDFLRRARERHEAERRAQIAAEAARERATCRRSRNTEPAQPKKVELPANMPIPGTAKELAMKLAAEHGFSWREILSDNRKRSLAAVRHKCIRAVADAKPHMSLTELGKVFQRDHSTILHSLNRTKQPGQWR